MKTIISEATELRKYLHAHPEVSSQEQQTSAYLKNLIRHHCTYDELIEFENYGFAVVFNGEKKGQSILVRADFDALPIQEINDFDHRSTVSGVSHKCGHDGHASILYGLARSFSENPLISGQAILLFQPAEENGEGAQGIVHDPKFEKLSPDYAVALHNLPGYPLHEIVIREGSFTAAANSIIIMLSGKTSHAAEPEMGINPALAMAEITQKILEQTEPDLNQEDFRIATPVCSQMGEKAYGVSAGFGELHFTLRAWSNDVMQDFEKQCKSIAEEVAQKYGLGVSIDWTESFFANINQPDVVKAIEKAAHSEGFSISNRSTPFKWGEDFGLFTERFPGAMFGIGSGENCPALHNPDYDFPDEILETGIRMFSQVIKNLTVHV